MTQDLLDTEPHPTDTQERNLWKCFSFLCQNCIQQKAPYKIRRSFWFVRCDYFLFYFFFRTQENCIKIFSKHCKIRHTAKDLQTGFGGRGVLKVYSWQSSNNLFCYHEDDFSEELQLVCPSSKSLLLWWTILRCYRGETAWKRGDHYTYGSVCQEPDRSVMEEVQKHFELGFLFCFFFWSHK